MRAVAPHLRLATLVRIANVWLLEDAGRRFLVDSGHPLERPLLLASLWRAGVRRRGDLAGVLLTHRHSDHAGNAAWLRRRFGCPVVCHERDAAVLSGASPPPPLAGRRAPWHQEVLCRIEDRFPARTPVDETWGGAGGWRHGFEVFPVGGHTEGSVLLYHDPTATLFGGDAILAGLPPLRALERLSLAVPGFSLDAPACHQAVARVVEALPPTRLFCSGHGPPVTRSAHWKLVRLLARRAAAS